MSPTTVSHHTIRMDEMRSRYCCSEANVEDKKEKSQFLRNTKGIKKEKVETADRNESTLYLSTQ